MVFFFWRNCSQRTDWSPNIVYYNCQSQQLAVCRCVSRYIDDDSWGWYYRFINKLLVMSTKLCMKLTKTPINFYARWDYLFVQFNFCSFSKVCWFLFVFLSSYVSFLFFVVFCLFHMLNTYCKVLIAVLTIKFNFNFCFTNNWIRHLL